MQSENYGKVLLTSEEIRWVQTEPFCFDFIKESKGSTALECEAVLQKLSAEDNPDFKDLMESVKNMVKAHLEEAKETLRIVYDKEYDDNVSKIIADLEMSSKILGRVLVGFGLKVVVGASLAALLIWPEQIQECDDGYDYSIMDENYREIDGVCMIIRMWISDMHCLILWMI